ncbi:MAG: hypothetical protein HYV59_05960 [Planctomycetes bacterium]|nr:hypothetical protein [Planctomycetota bacterium]
MSINTLLGAVSNILTDLLKTAGKSTQIDETLSPYLSKDIKKEVIKDLRKYQNFFKHAQDDPDDFLDFDPKQTEFLLYAATNDYGKLTGEQPPLFLIYRMWILAVYKDVFKIPQKDKDFLQQCISIAPMNKRAFLRESLPRIFALEIGNKV